MSKRKKASRSAAPSASPRALVAPPLSRRRLWLFRLLALFGLPLPFFLLLEFFLWIAGFGYPTAFLLPARYEGKAVLTQNNRFSWRFFGRQMARAPHPLFIPQPKPA